MNQAIVIELRFFITSLLWGVILLVSYDVLRIIRRVIKHNAFFVGLEDVIYWVIASVLIFQMMYKQNSGIIRGFAILAIFTGMLIYHGSISDFVVTIISNFINVIIYNVCKVIKLVFHFLSKILSVFASIFLGPLKFIYKYLKKLITFLLKPLKKNKKTSKIPLMEEESQ